MPRFPDALNEQIAREFAASQQYVAIAVYYDSETLPQLASHFYRQAVEERNHAMMIVQYLLDADLTVVIPAVDVRDLRRGEGDDLDVLAAAVDEVEVVEVAARGARDHDPCAHV